VFFVSRKWATAAPVSLQEQLSANTNSRRSVERWWVTRARPSRFKKRRC